MTGLGFALLLAVQSPQAQPAPTPPPVEAPRHWEDGQLRWRRFPTPTMPSREEGVVQARIRCAIATQGRVRDCQVVRLLPEDSAFGRAVLRSTRQARLREDGARPGDTMTFEVWACSDVSQPCRRRPWPQD